MILQLYDADPRGVVTNRICPMPDCSSAVVRREINGEYSLTATLPPGSLFENEIILGRAIKAVGNEAGNEQYFIIKNRPRSLSGGLSIYAEHQSYYYNGVIISGGAALPNGQPRVVFEALRPAAKPSITDISAWT